MKMRRPVIMRSLALVFACIGILITGPSYGACTKPDAPSCATETAAFADLADFDRCRTQMLAYKGSMESLITCFQKEGEPAQEQSARDELENTLSRFNRRARGE